MCCVRLCGCKYVFVLKRILNFVYEYVHVRALYVRMFECLCLFVCLSVVCV